MQPGFGNILVVAADVASAVAEHSRHPQVVGWWILAGLAALGVVTVVAQGLTRQAAAEAEFFPTLSALGMRPGDLFAFGRGRALMIGLAGPLGAAALAAALSPLTPLGLARVVETAPGLAFDGTVLPIGGWRCWWWSSWPGRGLRGAAPGRLSAAAAWVARSRGSPLAVIGTRWALERPAGPASTPPGLGGPGRRPRRRRPGRCFGVRRLAHPPAELLRTEVASLPGVDRISIGASGATASGTTPVNAPSRESLRGPLALSVVAGGAHSHPASWPWGIDHAATHTRIGATIPIAPVSETVSVRVVGEVALPVAFDSANGGLGTGAAMTIGAQMAAGCPPEQCSPERAPVPLIGFAPTAAGPAQARPARGRDEGPGQPLYYLQLQPASADPPTSLVNLADAVNFPCCWG